MGGARAQMTRVPAAGAGDVCARPHTTLKTLETPGCLPDWHDGLDSRCPSIESKPWKTLGSAVLAPVLGRLSAKGVCVEREFSDQTHDRIALDAISGG